MGKHLHEGVDMKGGKMGKTFIFLLLCKVSTKQETKNLTTKIPTRIGIKSSDTPSAMLSRTQVIFIPPNTRGKTPCGRSIMLKSTASGPPSPRALSVSKTNKSDP